MRRLVVILVLSVLGVAGATFGYLAYVKHERQRQAEEERARLISSLTPHVKNVSLRVINALRHETVADSGISFKELFERLEGDIVEADKRLLDVQTISSPETAPITDPVVAYIMTAQECIRALISKYRKLFAFNTASRLAEDSIDDLRSASGYSVDFERKRAAKAVQQVTEAAAESDASIPQLLSRLEKLKEARAGVAGIVEEHALVSLAQIDEAIAANQRTETK